MRLFALPVLALAFSTAASADVLWRGDYETGDLSQWAHIDGRPDRLTVVQGPVRQGKYALRVELHQGDFSSSGTRNEVENSSSQWNEVEGNDKWYAWSTMFPSDFPAPNTWQVFTQWHHSGCCGSPPAEFDVYGETIQLAHKGSTILWNTPLVRGVWHDFVVHVHWSSTSGFVDLYYDGTKVLDHKTVQTLNPGEYTYMKQGLYRDASISQVAVVYHDGMVMGTSLADVAPALAAPQPPPAPPGGGTDLPDGGTSVDPTDGGIAVKGSSMDQIPSGGCAHGSGNALSVIGVLAGALFVLRRRRR